MYRSAVASPFGPLQKSTRAYRQVGIETGVAAASPHQLVQMLFDGFIDTLVEARGALAAGRVESKCSALMRAVRIVDEGLKASLDVEHGSTLATDLADLYGYISLRLTQANLRNDAAAIEECINLMLPLRDAWQSIAAQAALSAAA
jgi:flagellar protein FliS